MRYSAASKGDSAEKLHSKPYGLKKKQTNNQSQGKTPTLLSYCLKIGPLKSSLKGQCHEMVVEVRPWSGRLGLNQGSRTPFSA
jgi:hypothetical protein